VVLPRSVDWWDGTEPLRKIWTPEKTTEEVPTPGS
jgi:hypothetical protein